MIAGNGIREGVEELAGSLQKTPGLHFSPALVELALYRLEPDRAWPILVQPRTLARTVEIERAIVTVHAPEGLEVEVALPAEDEAGKRRARTVAADGKGASPTGWLDSAADASRWAADS